MIIESLKKSRFFPWMSPEFSDAYKRRFAIAVSSLAAFGLHFTLDTDAHQLILQWPTSYEFAHGLLDWIGTVGMTEVFYKVSKR